MLAFAFIHFSYLGRTDILSPGCCAIFNRQISECYQFSELILQKKKRKKRKSKMLYHSFKTEFSPEKLNKEKT